MRKIRIIVIGIIFILTGVMVSLRSFQVEKSICYAEQTVTVTYYYGSGCLSYTVIEKGTKLTGTLDKSLYQSAVTLEDGYCLEWHVGSDSGEKWTTDYVFNADTSLYGVAVEEGEISVEDPSLPQPQQELPIAPQMPETPSSPEVPSQDEDGADDTEIIGEASSGEADNNKQRSTTEYKVTVDCDYAYYSISEIPLSSETVTITLYSIKDGYNIYAVTAYCGDTPIVVSREYNVISFVMPTGDVNVQVVFEESSDGGESLLTDNEKIALYITCGCVVLGGATIVVGKFFLRKHANQKAKKQ